MTTNAWNSGPSLELLAPVLLNGIKCETGSHSEEIDYEVVVAGMPVFDTFFNTIVTKEGMLMHGDLKLSDEDDEYGNPIVLNDDRQIVLMEANWSIIEPEQLRDAMIRAVDSFGVNVPMHTAKEKAYDFSRENGPWYKKARVFHLCESDVELFGVYHCEAPRINDDQPMDAQEDIKIVYGVICVTYDAIVMAHHGREKTLRIQQPNTKAVEGPNYLDAVAMMKASGPVNKMTYRELNGQNRKLFLPALPGSKENMPIKSAAPSQLRRLSHGRRR